LNKKNIFVSLAAVMILGSIAVAAATAPSKTNTAETKAEVSCRTLGLVPNDSSKAQSNYKLMLAALKSGNNIAVDDVYYMQSIYSSAADGNLIRSNVVIKGADKTKDKLIIQGGTYFNVKGDVEISGITIQGISTVDPSYLLELVAPYKLSVNVDSNYITGNIRLLSSRIPTTFDFAASDCGITELDITSNEFYDMFCSSETRSIIYVNDTPVATARISNNRVTNFSYIFYDNQITNGSPDANYVGTHSKMMYMDGNVVKCTDDYDAIKRNGGKLGYYYCFAITEMDTVECIGNTFEGFHVINSPGTVVYDNYFSVRHLTYACNTWKNIVNFTPGTDYVDIMKSKNGEGAPDSSRIYMGNHYITEASYADKFGQSRSLLMKQIDTYETWIYNVVIEDNTFDMYILSSPRYKKAINYTFKNNTLNLVTQESASCTQAYIGIQEYRDASGNLAPRQLTFTNNRITTLNPPSAATAADYPRYIIDNECTGENVSIDFENNIIREFNVNAAFSDENSYSGTKTIKNNQIFNNDKALPLQ